MYNAKKSIAIRLAGSGNRNSLEPMSACQTHNITRKSNALNIYLLFVDKLMI